MQEKAGKDEVSQCTSQNTTCEPFPTLFSQSRNDESLCDKLPTGGIRQMVGVKHTVAPAAYGLYSQREYTAQT